MPIYEFRCSSCNEILEYLSSGGDDKPDVCPSCGNTRLEKVISAPSIHSSDSASNPCGDTCGMDMPCCGADIPCRKRR